MPGSMPPSSASAHRMALDPQRIAESCARPPRAYIGRGRSRAASRPPSSRYGALSLTDDVGEECTLYRRQEGFFERWARRPSRVCVREIICCPSKVT